MTRPPVVLVVGARGPAHRVLPGVLEDVPRWIGHAPALAGADPLVFSLGDRPATADAIHTLAQQAVGALSTGGRLTVVVLGHGASTRTGGRGVVADDGVVVGLDTLVDGIPSDCTVTWFKELCGAGGPRRLDDTFRPVDVVHSACTVDQEAEQRRIDGVWRGAWSFAIDQVLQQATGTTAAGEPVCTLDHTTLSERAAQLVAGLGLDQTPQVSGPAERMGVRVSGEEAKKAASAPRLAMEWGAGNGIVLKDGTDAWAACRWVNNDLKWTLRTGETVADMPATLTAHWRQPDSGEINQLNGPTFTCNNVTFTNVGSVTASGGRMYSSSSRTLVIAFKSNFQKVTFWAENSAVDANNHIIGGANETMNHVTTAPSAPSGGWNKAVDKP